MQKLYTLAAMKMTGMHMKASGICMFQENSGWKSQRVPSMAEEKAQAISQRTFDYQT